MTFRETQTEFDGFFLFDGVPYGKYRLRIEKLSAQALRVSPAIGTSVTVDDDNQVARMGAVVAALDAVMAAKPTAENTP